MKKTVIAKIKWIPSQFGGRSELPPKGERYYPIIRFDHLTNEGNWSAEISYNEMDSNLYSVIELSYLVNEAPFENLNPGNTFKLYEGPHLVAEGSIINHLIND